MGPSQGLLLAKVQERLFGVQSLRAAPAGSRCGSRAWAQRERFCVAPRAPIRIAPFPTADVRVSSHRCPSFSLLVHPGWPCQVPALRSRASGQTRKLGFSGMGTEDQRTPAPGPAASCGPAGMGTSAGSSGTGWRQWHDSDTRICSRAAPRLPAAAGAERKTRWPDSGGREGAPRGGDRGSDSAPAFSAGSSPAVSWCTPAC